ncbi:ejaculatory bulb-specific protein 3 [Agrilus planipennis]|uniref:Ejaculatory bulb-specific protein 3 n=1 Tax=Agrilus planipennis TaxID=224129 RepID=A0A1W4XLL0_AGRPL|nr:ejaculatory bulb-specific protein 3 [Agrilus planipennis]
MRSAIVSLFLVFTIFTFNSLGDASDYSKRYEALDLDSILSNERILKNYINCFLDKGPCSPEARDFKKDIPVFIKSKCGDCTDVQRKVVLKASKFLIEKKPDEWKLLLSKYDPSGEYEAFLLGELKKQNS